jgi:hypothetical protein
MWMGKLIGNAAILIAGSIVFLAEIVAVGVLFLSATLIVVGRRLTHWGTGTARP